MDPAQGNATRRRLAEVLTKAEHLLDYALCSAGTQIETEAIAAPIVRMRKEFDAGGEIPPEIEVAFYAAFDRLSRTAHPMTTKSLKETAEAAGEMVLNTGRLTLLLLLFALTIAAMVQWVFLSEALRTVQTQNATIDSKSKDAQIVRVQIDTQCETQALRERNPDLIQSLQASLMGIDYEVGLIKQKIKIAYETLEKYSSPWVILGVKAGTVSVGLYPPNTYKPECTGQAAPPPAPANPKNVDRDLEETEQFARELIRALSVLWLPLTLGTFGASIYVLRQWLARMRSLSYTHDLWQRYYPRIALGAMLGPFVAYLVPADPGSLLGISVPSFFVAFLAGYNVELVFTALDKVADMLSQRLKIDRPPPAGGSGAAAQRDTDGAMARIMAGED